MPLKFRTEVGKSNCDAFLSLHSRSQIKRKKGAKGAHKIQPYIKLDIGAGLLFLLTLWTIVFFLF